MRYTHSQLALAAWLTVCLSACGGGGGGGNNGPFLNTPAQSDFAAGIFRDESVYRGMCANPRAGNPNDVQGTAEDENNWLRAWSNDLYLWYSEIVDEDPAAFTTPAYFDLMKTFELTPSGAPKDNFHFSLDTAVWEAESQGGIVSGYGWSFEFLEAAPPRELIVTYVLPGTPAADAGVVRGDRILFTDGADVVNGNTQADVDAINNALFPNLGEAHTFDLTAFDGSNARQVTMTSQTITENAILTNAIFNTSAGPVGYFMLNTFLDPAEPALFDQIEAFAAAGVQELIVDLRYNPGGFADIANMLSYMIAGPASAGRVFAETIFNDKHPDRDPVTNAPLDPVLFSDTTPGFALAPGQPLPTLNLINGRVLILTTAASCSASEFVINALRGINFDVIQIGGTTCGKPYGFYPTDNCGTTYFSIQFTSANEQGFGEFSNGFVPTQSPGFPDEVLGCPLEDDFSSPLGDASEGLLSAALNYIETGACPANAVTLARGQRVTRAVLDEWAIPMVARQPRFPGAILRR